MRHRWIGILVAIGSSLALLSAACSSGGDGGGGAPTGSTGSGAVTEGGVVRIGTATGIDSMNPFVAFNQDAFAAFEYVYPFLVQYDSKTLDFVEDFASKWETSSDQLTWTFHTIAGAKWSDGQPLTAADAAWTYNTILKFGNGPTAAFVGDFAHVKSITTPDPNTIVVVYSAPVANVLSNLQQVPILPQHVWAPLTTGNGKALKTAPNAPTSGHPLVSGGPFQMYTYEKEGTSVFKTNPTFYGPKPHVEGFGLQFFSNDDGMVQALKSGQIDAVNSFPVTAIDTTGSDPAFTIYEGQGLEFRDFIFNSNPKKANHRELLNPQVRQAFEYAIDRDSIVKTAWLGHADPGTTIVPAGTPEWHDPSIQPLPFNLGLANQTLDRLGYAKGSDGIRVAEGHPMSYTVVFPHAESGPGDRAFQIIQSDFAQIGMKLTQRNYDDTAAFSAITSPGETGYLDFDLAMWDWVPLEDPDFILSVLNCNQYGSWSDTGYCNKQYDQLYEQQGVTTNMQKRQEIVFQMQKMAFDDRPYIVYAYNKVIDAWSNKWTGFVESNQNLFNILSKESLTQVHLAG
jgi:peptide/nickel transport system substrate-binding protein